MILSMVVVATLGASWRARGAAVERHLEPGVLVGRGFPEIGALPTFGGDITCWWSPTAHLDLGLEIGGAVTLLPYGNTDGEPVVGRRGGDSQTLNRDVTFLPRVMFGTRAFLSPGVWAGLFMGHTQIASGELGAFSVIPYPTASVALESRFGANGRYGVRAAFSYMHFWFKAGDALMISTLAFTWGG
jgi:hypothetical protein